LNRGLNIRTDVVSIFPDTASVIRLVGALLVEINDEMIAADRRCIAGASVAEIDGITPGPHSSQPPARPTANNRTARTSYITARDAIRSPAGSERVTCRGVPYDPGL
jgi:hypothetical protein